MDLYASIGRRKSCRSFTSEPLPAARLAEIKAAIAGFEPLYPQLPLASRFVTETKGLFHVRAPHYLIVSGQGQAGELENAGFLFQQLALWLDANELGCVWLGKAKDTSPRRSENDLITIAFGQAEGSPHRAAGEFTRRPIEEITNAPQDECIKAVHLAPSGMNLQPWYLEKQAGRVLLYEQRPKGPTALLYKLSDLDMGIALSHYMLACRHLGRPFAFSRQSGGAAREGAALFGEITGD